MNEKVVAYVAGAFRSREKPGSQWEQFTNIRRAEEVALEVWKLGAVAICPHLNTLHFQGELPDHVWLEGDLELVRRSDVLIMVSGWQFSKGAVAEKAFAEQFGIPVFYAEKMSEFQAWMEGLCYAEESAD